MISTRFLFRVFTFRRSILKLVALHWGASVGQGAVYLSFYNIDTNLRPVVATNEALSAPYKLRVKVIGVPGYPDGFHAANGWNNHNSIVDAVPPPGNYLAQLYWVKYATDYNTVVQVGPFSNYTLTVRAPAANGIAWTSINLPVTGLPGQTISFNAGVQNAGGSVWDANYYLELKDGNGTHLYYPSINGVAPGGSIAPSFVLTLPSSAGSYTYYFTALQNGVQYFGGSQSRTIIVNRNPVTATVGLSAASLSVGQAVNIASSTTDGDGNLTSHALDYLPPGGSAWTNGTINAGTRWDGPPVSSKVLSSSVLLPMAGTWQFRARGSDNLGGYSNFQTQSLQVYAAAPIAVSLALEVTALASGQATVARSNATPAGQLTYHGIEGRIADGIWQNWGSWNDSGGNLQSVSVGPGAGVYEIRAYAARADAVRTYSSSTWLTVNGLPIVTVQPSPATKTVTVGGSVVYNVVATGALSYQWYRNASVVSSAISIPTATSPTFTLSNVQSVDDDIYRVLISNGLGSVWTSAVRLMVAPPVPVINSPLSASLTTGVGFNYLITALNAPISFSASGLPAGLIFNSATGSISGIPNQGGTFAASISASNLTGSSTPAILVLSVSTNGANLGAQLRIHRP